MYLLQWLEIFRLSRTGNSFQNFNDVCMAGIVNSNFQSQNRKFFVHRYIIMVLLIILCSQSAKETLSWISKPSHSNWSRFGTKWVRSLKPSLEAWKIWHFLCFNCARLVNLYVLYTFMNWSRKVLHLVYKQNPYEWRIAQQSYCFFPSFYIFMTMCFFFF